ncbi:hypothetical protein G7Y89_g5627 [Cudoniella acicularis]|uniref:Uncharacterized protein n=1 Tax=Cudoniella acicularis TaxID=354080 RepID=A0A8H4RQC5_9HELO|nr:hypothetical protein G7Y89_g5627 [Cudoniella acicularis]
MLYFIGSDPPVMTRRKGSFAQENVKKLEELGDKTVAVQADISDSSAGKNLVDTALKDFQTDTIDIIINNAVIVSWSTNLQDPINLASFENEYNVNVRGPQLLIQATVPHMRPGGRIVNISTIVAKVGSRYMLTYSASKGALNSLTVSLAEELGPKSLAINAMALGPVETDSYQTTDKNLLFHRLHDRRADIRAGEPWEVAEVVLFFASLMASFVNGQVLLEPKKRSRVLDDV